MIPLWMFLFNPWDIGRKQAGCHVGYTKQQYFTL